MATRPTKNFTQKITVGETPMATRPQKNFPQKKIAPRKNPTPKKYLLRAKALRS
jgi:hypothetical protein